MAVPAERPKIAGVIFLLLAGVAIAAIILQTWWAISQDRNITFRSEHENGLVAVRLLEEHATQTLNEADGNLSTVINAIQSISRERELNDDIIRELITKAQPFNKILKALQYVNVAGKAFVSTIDYPAYQVDADERTYIPYLLKHPEIKHAVIGQPFQRFYDTELVVPLARNLYADNGSHLGIISTDLSVSYFSAVYARIAKDSKAIVSLFTENGTVIVRFPFDKEYIGKEIRNSPVIRELASKPVEGNFRDAQFLDEKNQIERLYTYRKIASFPIVSVFARDSDSILMPWRERTRDRLVFSGITILLLCILTFSLWVHIHRLHLSEDSLRKSEMSLRVSESKFVNLFKFSPVPLALISLADDKLVEVNDSLLRQTGFQVHEMMGKTPQELQLWEDVSLRENYLKLLKEQGFVDQFEMRFRYKNGKIATCLLSSRLFESGGNKMVIFTPIDISQIRAIENEIRQLNADLEKRVVQRTLSLEETNNELANALDSLTAMQGELIRSEKMAALGSLVAGIAHELNTPIGNSVTVASTLQDHAVTMENELSTTQPRRSVLAQLTRETSKGANILVRSLDRAAQLILSFKQVAVDQSSNHRRNFDLSTTLNEILVTLEPMYSRSTHHLHIDFTPDIMMESYPGALAQIITNSVNNCLTHAFENLEHGNMYLKTRLFGQHQVEIIFSDDGTGISPEHLARVFDPFFTTKLGKGGSGLGMHIVYNLVTDVLGGKIDLESEPGEGTTISLLLPLIAPVNQTDKFAA
ncbi:ATP-binding protein [Undibacterium umbellatum]|uniref:histidine kinase n=1 Tax=Undibacterium umbellatum TaxID=2762300 RepID=A0ABR6Z4H1_9BURK|nr:ATP-binding protein [Undibacterium umbellatum]MBC3906446.1 PAS domain S-box protein [Undibacterium umbellatum]